MLRPETLKEDAMRYMKIHGVKDDYLKFLMEKRMRCNGEESINSIPKRKNFALLVDVMLLTDVSVQLAQLVIDDPKSAEEVFIEALSDNVKHNLSSIMELYPFGMLNKENLDISLRKYIIFRLNGIPSILHHNSFFTPRSQKYDGLVVFRGLVVSKTPILKYTRAGVYKCSNKACHSSNMKKLLISWRNFSERCLSCSSALVEKVDEREMGDYTKAIIIPKLDSTLGNGITQAVAQCYHGIIVRFCDDLASDVNLGDEYDIAASIGTDGLHAYYSRKLAQPAALNTFSLLRIDRILSLREKTSSSPWAFFIALASKLGSFIYPIQSFLNLKRALLLSLASVQQRSTCRPIHVFSVGSEGLPAHRLMFNASTLARHAVQHSGQQPVTGKVRWQEELFGSDSKWLDAGSLFLAQGGICYLGDWARHKHETQLAVFSAIEKKEVTITSNRTTANAELSYHLQSAVWIHCSIKKTKKLRPLIDVFGIPFITELGKDEEEVIDSLLHHSLYNDVLKTEENFEWNEELKMMIGSCEISISPKAAQLIQDYFVASRRCRGIVNSDECLPIVAVDILTKMSEAHARLSLHSIVTWEDALAAISLCEESLSALYGQTFMSPPPLLRINKSDCSNFAHEVDYQMKEFALWMERFLKDLIGAKSSLTSHDD